MKVIDFILAGGFIMSFLCKLLYPFIVVTICASLCSCVDMQNNSQVGAILSSLSTSSANQLDESTIASGLRQALEVGSARASQSASTPDGFLANNKIRIALPESLNGVTDTLRKIGFGSQVDQFEVKMNRAAESAAAEAKPVFISAVKGMTLTDAMSILKGSDTAATDYFRSKTSATLQQKFKPVVRSKMEEVGVYGIYNQLLSTYNALPLVEKTSFDLESYLSTKTQDGLFTLLAEEEVKIRNNPAARTTELLKQVFSNR